MIDGSSNGPGVPNAVAASIERWKQALLDLSKRNRALAFRPNRVSTITVVGEQPPEVLRRLYVDRESMGFLPLPEPVAETTNPSEPAISQRSDSGDFAPYDRAALADHHTDRWLQTQVSPADLDKSLRRIDDLARSSLEEQGVNTLFLALGMLHYREPDDAEQVFAAPLVLLPVRLVRAATHSAFEIIAADDDVTVNPTLTEYLRKLWGIELPPWSDGDGASEPDLQQLFVQVSERIHGRSGWRLTNEIVLSLFSFEKLVMFKDLEASAATIGAHALVQQLVTRQGATASGLGLPPEILHARLDELVPPERSAHLVPADGSQLRALLAVTQGHSLVVEGPPGTGKSQTITNLVAQALAAGKSVLFVAEKRAALDVVHARLQAAGLGEHCLALHSPDANRRAVFEGMRAALDASAASSTVRAPASTRLPALRDTLSGYVDALHRERAPQGASVFEALCTLAPLASAPLLPWDGSVSQLGAEHRELGERSLLDLTRAAAMLGDPTTHPWRDATRTSFPELVLQEVMQVAGELDQQLARFEQLASQAAATLGMPMADSFAWLPQLGAAADVLRRSTGAAMQHLRDPAWDQPPLAATSIIAELEQAQQLRAVCAQRFVAEALTIDHRTDIAYVRGKRGIAAAFTWLDGRYKAIRRRWERLRAPGYAVSMHEQADDLEAVGRFQQLAGALAPREADARALFGPRWRGLESTASELRAYVQWVVDFRRLANTIALGTIAFELAARGSVDISVAVALAELGATARASLARLSTLVQWPPTYLEAQPIAAIRERAAELLHAPALAPAWGAYEAARQAAFASIAIDIARRASTGALPFPVLRDAFVRSFWSRWLTEVIDLEPALASFQGLVHEQRIEEFRALDRAVLLENRERLVAELRARLQARLREPELQREIAVLLPEVRKQGRHKPLRKTLLAAGAAARAIHPCWLMSPLSVSQFTQPGGAPFDLVIFDEASQLRPEDAIASIARGRQLVVVGDPKQLPPTDFFGAQWEPAATADDEHDDHPDAPSILEVAGGAGLPATRLKWHYRSAHESLIAFSNQQFYDTELRTFPSVEHGTAARGLCFELVEDGIYEGNGRNRVEAQRVVEAILAFAREQQRKPLAQRWSLGVGTFSLPQRLEIDELLYQHIDEEPELAEFFDRDREDPFFIKNLESIQGDERDAIFLSITYGRGSDGLVRHNFGPLNREGGWKRLNVITTRARQLMRVFSSIRGRDIEPGRAKIAGVLRGFLDYAETGRLPGTGASRPASASSPFERELAEELGRRGYDVELQVGECGYRIDLAVRDPEQPDRYLIGIECDGAAYRASETARDRDRLRDEVLRARGWTLTRVWSTDWFKARAGQIDRLVRAIEAAREQRRAVELAAREPAAQPDVAGEPAPADAAATDAVPDGARAPAVMRKPVAGYRLATGKRVPAGALIDAPVPKVVEQLVEIVRVESPIHEDELVARLASFWGHQRGGARIREHVLLACRSAQQAGTIERRGPFVWMPGSVCAPRLRGEDARVVADRIAPEEWEATIRWALGGGVALPRERLIAEVRGALGFARTGKNLEARIGERIDGMRDAGELVEVSLGLRLANASGDGGPRRDPPVASAAPVG